MEPKCGQSSGEGDVFMTTEVYERQHRVEEQKFKDQMACLELKLNNPTSATEEDNRNMIDTNKNDVEERKASIEPDILDQDELNDSDLAMCLAGIEFDEEESKS